jgi:arabinose-5-phosphate isomerase
VVLINQRKFTPTDFKKFHPGGNLGHRLSSLKVRDIMLTGDRIPVVSEHTDMAEALDVLDKGKLGVVLIRNRDNVLVGIITDGDVRRMLVKKIPVFDHAAKDLMVQNPKSIPSDTPLYDALNLMENHQITVLPAIDGNGTIAGVLHLHDILGKGAVKFNGI